MSGRYVSRVFESNLSVDLKFTAAVFASFADEAGHFWPSIGHVAHLRGLTERAVQYHVKEFRRMEIFEVVRPATQWSATHYRMAIEKLPTRAPYKPPERQRYLLGPPPRDSGVQPAAPQPGVQFEASGVQPVAPDPSVDPSVHTRTAHAREATDGLEVQPAAPLNPRLPLLPVRAPGHEAHAWCGRICVPKFLHKEFKKALGGPVKWRPKKMRAFYAETLAAIPAARPIGNEPLKFWRAAFAVRYGGAGSTRRQANVFSGGDCTHHPPCETRTEHLDRTFAEIHADTERRKSG